MKIGGQVRDLVVVGDVGQTRKATISGDKMAKLQQILTKGLYKDPITAVIAEWTNNGIDGVVQAGKNPLDNPVIVTIGQNKRGQFIFSVEDKGTGLDDREFEDICMNYLESTKEQSDETIGCYGIGMKSFLALERSATFTCRKNGMERVYLVYEGEEFVNYDMTIERETQEEDGVKAELVIQNLHEKAQFVFKARQKLAYYDTAVLVVDEVAEVWSIQRNDLFQRSDANTHKNMHLCLKDVYYTIDWDSLGIPAIPLPIALCFSLKDGIRPTPSRESYITNEKTKKLIMDRIGKVADWMITKYNETVKEFDKFVDAYPYLGISNPMLHNDGYYYQLDYVTPYSSIIVLKPKVKGITLRDPDFYKQHRDQLFYEYIPVGYTNSSGIYRNHKPGRWNILNFQGVVFDRRDKPIIVNEGMKGNLREYLKEKYGKDTMYCRVNPVERKLDSDDPNKMKIDVNCYMNILNLHLKPKKEWRALINEWKYIRDQLAECFIDERGAEGTKDYQDWLVKRKAELYLKRKPSSYKGLNKKAGDVTISYLMENKRGLGWQKFPQKIHHLVENHYLTVLIDDEDSKSKDVAKVIQSMLKTDKVRFATVGKKEGKKIPNHYQFINYQKFMTRDCKPFMRLASAIAFQRLLEHFDRVFHSNEVLKNCLSGMMKDKVVLASYVEKNTKNSGTEEVRDAVIDVATKHELFDKELWDVYTRLKDNIKKYDFISCLDQPRSWNVEEVKKYQRTIGQMLLFRKIFHNDLPEEIVVTYQKKK